MGLALYIDGKRADAINQRLKSVTVTDAAADEADSLRFIVSIGGDNVAIPRMGAVVTAAYDEITVGGKFAVNRIHGSNYRGEMIVACDEYDYSSEIKSPRNASFTGDTVSSIINTLAARYGTRAHISPALQSLIPAEALQRGETDMSFMRRLAAGVGGTFTIKDGFFLLLGATSATSTSGKALPSASIDYNEPDSQLSYAVSRRDQQRLRISYYDADGVTVKSFTSGKGKTTDTLPEIYPSREAAELIAKTIAAKKTLNIQEVTISTKLRLDIRAGFPMQLTNLPNGLSSNTKIINITHFFSDNSPPKSEISAVFSPFTED